MAAFMEIFAHRSNHNSDKYLAADRPPLVAVAGRPALRPGLRWPVCMAALKTSAPACSSRHGGYRGRC